MSAVAAPAVEPLTVTAGGMVCLDAALRATLWSGVQRGLAEAGCSIKDLDPVTIAAALSRDRPAIVAIPAVWCPEIWAWMRRGGAAACGGLDELDPRLGDFAWIASWVDARAVAQLFATFSS
jgi:hypothetical protein